MKTVYVVIHANKPGQELKQMIIWHNISPLLLCHLLEPVNTSTRKQKRNSYSGIQMKIIYEVVNMCQGLGIAQYVMQKAVNQNKWIRFS